MALRLCVDGWWLRGPTAPRFLAIEMLAQAAVLLVQQEGKPGLLAGVEEARWSGDLAAGDDLVVSARLEARFGRLAKIAGEISRDGEEVFSARLVVQEA